MLQIVEIQQILFPLGRSKSLTELCRKRCHRLHDRCFRPQILQKDRFLL